MAVQFQIGGPPVTLPAAAGNPIKIVVSPAASVSAVLRRVQKVAIISLIAHERLVAFFMTSIKRKVFYLGGFDPRGVRYYYGLLKEQVKKLATNSGSKIDVGPRSFGDASSSTVRVTNHTDAVETDYVFLRWEDFVKPAWIRNPAKLIYHTFDTYISIFRYCDWTKARALGRGPLVTLIAPFVLLIGLPPLLFALTFIAAMQLLPTIWAVVAGIAISAILAMPLLAALHSPWLLRFFIFNNWLAGDRWPGGLDARLNTFAEMIAAPADEYDEVLLVTHSNGSILAIPILERLRSLWKGVVPANFALVTLGHCIPLIALRRDATRFAAQMRNVGTLPLRWIDIGSPPDGAAYHGIDPLLLVCDQHNARIDLLSPRFHIFYDPANYHRGYRNKFNIHFDYLRTGDRVSPLDLPSIIAGPRTIDQAVAAFKAIG